MDTQLVAEKILTFCKAKYPDLDWSHKYQKRDNIVFISGSCSLFKLELEICSDKSEHTGYYYKQKPTYDYIRGWIDVLQYVIQEKSRLFWSGSFKVRLNKDKDSELEFTAATCAEWDDNTWSMTKKARKMLREIFGFIEDEIQE